ncbi:MAG: hypothetical protein Tsb002_01620 [Wenzhouxiangellaceae bacterium]
MFKKILMVVLMLGVYSLVVAENEQGTGQPTINMALNGSNEAVIVINAESLQLFGASALTEGYGKVTLSALDQASGALQTQWGRAEILLGCYQADVVLYQQTSSGWEELIATVVAIDHCQTQ